MLFLFSSMFGSSKYCKLGTIENVEHFIELINREKVVAQPMRRIPLAYIDKSEKLVKEIKNSGIVIDSLSS